MQALLLLDVALFAGSPLTQQFEKKVLAYDGQK